MAEVLIYTIMDERQKHYPRGKKPDTEGHIWYESPSVTARMSQSIDREESKGSQGLGCGEWEKRVCGFFLE
jgi:hypothetical protein